MEGALSGDTNAGISVGLEGDIKMMNVFGRYCMNSAEFGGCNARGAVAGTWRTTIRSSVCALLNRFAGNNDSEARTVE